MADQYDSEHPEQVGAGKALWNELSEQLAPPPSQPPSELFHYTSPRALLGMVGHRNEQPAIIHCTHFKHTNDSGEIKYGYRFVQNVASEIVAESQDTHGRAILEHFATEYGKEQVEPSRRPYLASFSTVHDKLSQWRIYADSGLGYCLGIRPERVPLVEEMALRWIRVLYRPEEVKELIRNIFRSALKLRDEFDARRSPAVPSNEVTTRALREVFDVIACCVKHESFTEESEWRLVALPSPSVPPSFHAERGLVPYFEVALDRPGQKAWLSSVYVGPVPNRDAVEEATRALLKARGYSPKLVKRFETTYRPR